MFLRLIYLSIHHFTVHQPFTVIGRGIYPCDQGHRAPPPPEDLLHDLCSWTDSLSFYTLSAYNVFFCAACKTWLNLLLVLILEQKPSFTLRLCLATIQLFLCFQPFPSQIQRTIFSFYYTYDATDCPWLTMTWLMIFRLYNDVKAIRVQ